MSAYLEIDATCAGSNCSALSYSSRAPASSLAMTAACQELPAMRSGRGMRFLCTFTHFGEHSLRFLCENARQSVSRDEGLLGSAGRVELACCAA